MKTHNITGAVLIGLLLTGCTARVDKAIPWPFENHLVVFIELREVEEGKVIQGNYPPGRRIDFPTYFYDEKQGTLTSQHLSFELDDTLKVVFGRYGALRGAAGGGVASRLYGVYRFPYLYGDLVLRGVDENGKAHLQFRDSELIVDSHDEWKHTETRRDTVDILQYAAVAEFTTTIRIINHGVMEKAKIHTW